MPCEERTSWCEVAMCRLDVRLCGYITSELLGRKLKKRVFIENGVCTSSVGMSCSPSPMVGPRWISLLPLSPRSTSESPKQLVVLCSS